MNSRLRLGGVLIIIGLIIVAGLFMVMQVVNRPEDTSLSNISSSDTTIAFERTAIAIFTQNPTLALSSTPYYAEIIYNEALRYITVSPTFDPTLDSDRCWPVADFLNLESFSNMINQTIQDADIEATTQVFTSGVWGADSTCDTFHPVSTRIRVWVESTDTNDPVILGDVSAVVIESITIHIENEPILSPVFGNISLDIYFNYEDTQLNIATTWDIAVQVSTQGLTGAALIEALGGIIMHD